MLSESGTAKLDAYLSSCKASGTQKQKRTWHMKFHYHFNKKSGGFALHTHYRGLQFEVSSTASYFGITERISTR